MDTMWRGLSLDLRAECIVLYSIVCDYPVVLNIDAACDRSDKNPSRTP